jgi:glycosyltransferase involved in cell wall biosynthesis
MPEYRIKINIQFTDKETGETVRVGDVFTTSDLTRAKDIIRRGLGKFAGVVHKPKTGNRILIHQKYCYKIGGIETANRAIAEAFPDRNIVFVFGDADFNQAMHLAKYHDVIIDDGIQTYECDVAIFTNYDSAPAIMKRIKARRIYQQIHADFENLKKIPVWKDFTWHPDPKIDKVLSVSKTAQKALERCFQQESKVVPNILPKRIEEPFKFLVLSRATPEKGIDDVVKLLKRFDDAKKDYVLFLCSTIEQAGDNDQIYLRENPRVLTIKPCPYAKVLLSSADMLIQCSKNESYCYSVREALQAGTPCLVSDIPELRTLIEEGKNGYIYKEDMDIEKLFDRGLKANMKAYDEKISPLWEKVLDGEL